MEGDAWRQQLTVEFLPKRASATQFAQCPTVPLTLANPHYLHHRYHHHHHLVSVRPVVLALHPISTLLLSLMDVHSG